MKSKILFGVLLAINLNATANTASAEMPKQPGCDGSLFKSFCTASGVYVKINKRAALVDATLITVSAAAP